MNLARQQMNNALKKAVGDRLSDSTIDKVLRNVASSWTQSGHLKDTAVKFDDVSPQLRYPQPTHYCSAMLPARGERPSFQVTPECKKRLADRVLVAQVESVLIDEFPRILVTAENGEAAVNITTGLSIHTLLLEKQKIVERVEALAIELGGAEKVRVTFDHPI
jgi:hypothetical protein